MVLTCLNILSYKKCCCDQYFDCTIVLNNGYCCPYYFGNEQYASTVGRVRQLPFFKKKISKEKYGKASEYVSIRLNWLP